MPLIAFLIGYPFLAALILYCMKKHGRARRYFIFFSSFLVIAAVTLLGFQLFTGGDASYLPAAPIADRAILGAEIILAAIVVYFGVKHRRYDVVLLSVAQTGLIAWLELSGMTEILPAAQPHILLDKFSFMMCVVAGVVGGLICIYAAGYMKEFHEHHTEFKDRRPFFFSMLFVFLGAMFGLVLSTSLLWIYFFWEITSLVSFLLIGYNQKEESIKNAFRSLWMNLLGGLGFAIAIAYGVCVLHIGTLQEVVACTDSRVLIPIALLALAALIKSAQLPFSRWLLGAMVAPTPTSALLHSATMVKAGVYLLLRLSPALGGNLAGTMVTVIGGFTFFATSLLAISQSDGKKVLAYSTVSNLGLIVACAGVGLYEAAWAGMLLVLFHAVSKSLMFLSVGAVENQIGSRNIEDMHGLIVKLPELALVMILGIAGMFLAPFGMLISKWGALMAFVDADNLLLVILVAFGSATTMFYWTKWLGKLVAVLHHSERLPNKTKGSEWFTLCSLAVLMVALCFGLPFLSKYLVGPILLGMFGYTLPDIISGVNLNIMTGMLILIILLPFAVRFLTFGKRDKLVGSYMGGANEGDDRYFVDSFGQRKAMYLSSWYMPEFFGERVLLKPVLGIAAATLVILLTIAIGGAI